MPTKNPPSPVRQADSPRGLDTCGSPAGRAGRSSAGIETEETPLYAVVFAAKEARSGVHGNPIVTHAGDRFYLAKEPEGWVPATASRYRGGPLPADAMTWDTAGEAERFAHRWSPHPWWDSPAPGAISVVLVRRVVRIVRETVGFEVADA